MSLTLAAPTSNSNSVVVVALVFLFSTTLANSFNITKILSKTSDFGSFNDLLTKSGVAETIDSRTSVTVLALDNGAAGALHGKPKDEVQRILMSHVILDYYDLEKFKKLPNNTATLTTLFQASGAAQPGQGFLNVTVSSSGDILFGSQVKHASLVAKAVKSVFAEPYNISVVQISQGIVAPGIDAPAPYTNYAIPPPPSKKAPAPSSTSYKAPNKDDNETAAAPASESVDSGAPSAFASGAAVAVLMGLVFNYCF